MDIEPTYVTSRDGTRIAIYETGPAGAPVLVLSHGLGGSIVAWRHLIRHFSTRFRIVSWDYRGLYRSARPPDAEGDATYTMARHCEDLEAMLAALHVESAVFLGWSMGVQVNFDFCLRHPDVVRGLVQINGTSGRIFDTAFRGEWLRAIAPFFLDLMEGTAPVLGRVGPALEPVATRTRAVVAFAKATGLCSPTLDEAVFNDIAGDFLKLDFAAYGRIFRDLGNQDAGPFLRDIRVPTLVITGERDLFTPLEVSERIAREVPGAELTIIGGGTHYTPIEYPVVVNLRIEKFLRERLGL